ncbi:MAG TPA: tetratricopeptide repeat protein [Gemmataceae bacterium]|nr:tetratricopeptide repeat protein [Gemmataceae bacterium]
MKQRIGLALGCLVLLSVGTALLVPYAWSRSCLAIAEQALRRQDLESARQYLQRCLQIWPSSPRAHFLATQTARRLDSCAEAEHYLVDYERRYGETEESRLEWLLLGVQQGDLAGELSYLQSLVDAKHSSTPLILEAMAKGYLRVARWASMLVCLNGLLQSEPTNPRALLLRGKRSEGIHDLERAARDFEHVLELVPDCSEARLRLAETLHQQGRVREAVAHFEMLHQQDPTNRAVLLGLARCRFEAHELDQAGEFLDTLLAARPDDVDALVERGRLAMSRRRRNEAEPHLTRAVALAPWHREAFRLLQNCLEASGKNTLAETCQARRDALQASDRQAGQLWLRYHGSPRDAAVRFEVAMWALHNGHEPEGLGWLFRTLLIDPRHPAAHAALADYFERSGQPKRCALHRRQANGESV